MKLFKQIVLAAASVAIVLSTTVSCTQKEENKVQEEVQYTEGIEKGIEQIMNDLHVVGLGVAVVSGDSIIYHNAWGYKTLETQTPLAEDDLFRIASISKSFTATSKIGRAHV